MAGVGEEAEATWAVSASRTACHAAARRCYFAPFFEAGLEAGALFARAGAFSACAGSDPGLKLTRLPAGVWRGAPPPIAVITRAHTPGHLPEPKTPRHTLC